MRLVDNLKVLLVFLGIVQICPAPGPGFGVDLPCVVLSLAGYLLLQRSFEDRLKERIDNQQQLLCAFLVSSSNIDTCRDCLRQTNKEDCDAVEGTIECQFTDGLCGPSGDAINA